MTGEEHTTLSSSTSSPPDRSIADPKQTRWTKLKTVWSRVAVHNVWLLTSAFRFAPRLLAVAATGAIFLIFMKAFWGTNTIDLRSIEVPNALSDAGLTSKVVTRRLRDALNANRNRMASQVVPTNFLVRQDLPEVSIPETALSLDRAVSIVRSLLPSEWRHDEISGEFTLFGKRLALELRLNDRIVFAGSTPFSPDDDVREVRHLLSTAAFAYTLQRYTTVIRNNPSSAPLRIALGYLWSDNGRLDNAVDSFNDALVLDPSKPDAYVALGGIARSRFRWDEARRRFQEALKRDPTNADAYTGLGYTYLREGDTGGNLELATHAFNQSSHHSGGSADSRIGLGKIYMTANDLDKAVREFQEAIRLYPDAPDPYMLLGAARFHQKRFDDSITAYQAAGLLNPLSFEPNLGIGRAKLAQQLTDEAMSEFREAIRLSHEAFAIACKHITEREADAPSGASYPEIRRRLEAFTGGTEKCPPAPAQ